MIWSPRRLFVYCYKLYQKTLSARLEERGVPISYPQILGNLWKDGPCNQRKMAHLCLMKPSSLTNVFRDMEAEGLIVREMGGKRRETTLYITEKGIEMFKVSQAVFDELEEVMYRGFSDEEKAVYDEHTMRVIKNLMAEEQRSGRIHFNGFIPKNEKKIVL